VIFGVFTGGGVWQQLRAGNTLLRRVRVSKYRGFQERERERKRERGKERERKRERGKEREEKRERDGEKKIESECSGNS